MQINFTIRKKDRGYQLIASYKVGKLWKQKSRQGFATKAEAKAYQADMLKEIEKTANLDKELRDITLKDFAERFVLSRKDLAYNTKRAYRDVLKRVGTLSNMPVKNISYIHLAAVLNALLEEYSTSTVNYTIQVLKILFNRAIDYDVITDSPARKVKLMRDKRTEKRKALNDRRYRMLLKKLHPLDDYKQGVIFIACKTGMRYGEIMGLTWDCYNPRKRTLTINKQYTPLGFSPVKNKYGNRTIPITKDTVEFLNTYRSELKAIPIDNRIFSKSYCSSKINNALKKLTGCGFSIHSLRHTYATRLLANGVDIKTVAALLGDTVETVINNYIHVTDEMRKEAADLIENIF